MTQQKLNPFRFQRHESVYSTRARHRRSRVAARAIAAILAFTIPVLPMTSAFAGAQVLEIPQATSVPVTPSSSTSTYGSAPDSYGTAPDSYPDPTSGSTNPANPPRTVASNSESYPPGPNLGSISDYQNQQGENARPAGIAFGGGTRRHEPQSSMTTNLIVGGLIVGLVALEMASHHRHHR